MTPGTHMTSPRGSAPTSVMRGAFLTVAMRWSDRLIGIASTLILARLLVPDDFGVIAMASLVIGLIDVLFDMGVHIALIQNRDATPAHYHTAWTLRLLQAISSMLIIIALAPLASDYFNESRLTVVLQVLSIGLVLAALENMGVISFQKEMRFGLDFRFIFSKRLAGFVVTIVAAFLLKSYWALVIGALSGRVVGIVLSYSLHPMRPRFTLEKFRDIFAVSQWMLLKVVANYLNANLHQFFVGDRSSATTMGGYSLANQISAMPGTELLTPINRVLFPAFVQAKHDMSELKRVFLLAQGVQTLVAIPFSVGLALLAREAVFILLGAPWLFIVPFVQVLALANIAQAISTSGDYVLFTLGEFGRQTMLTVFTLLTFIAGALLLIPNGDAQQIATLRLACILVGLVCSVWLLLRSFKIVRLADIAGAVYRPIVASALMALAIHAIDTVVTTNIWLSMALKVTVGGLVYLVCVVALWHAGGRRAGSEQYILDKLRGLPWFKARAASVPPA